ncbi:Crp/Fnr family transcriptional regulator [Poseidonibacter ostreae]|uniref:Cyclic nucleotide-binding domain-containing protein n=1 Tax=Poseidonibacter ostreae TaxID=2654171 RepID=A0A6L4WW74_9BACT|nr:Crp/Fnr family transcriptional regulator [Poseidonibacter ostreae]KAB7888012.1 cyclic nucleotide-binding domain-containing protein [Poseidonibacter ostreae]KAB7891069.1 cyclic nucleotide-binding domain-containing protein [Poseidonibacter ostreae]KAB7892793.1 cyclic nucleotide-binding domain-containing protein [Poseidonibacter ostreae]MAD40768.1 Crp/Fnr family transcriptional regulator [Arcobacter sp.]
MKVKLKDIYLFKDLRDETISQIEEFTTLLKLSKDNIIFYEGDESRYLYILAKGIVKLYKTASNDKEIIMKYFHSNELIAEVANFEEIPYPATAQCFSESEVLRVDFVKLKEVIYQDPELSFMIQTSLIKKIRNLEKLVSLHVVLDSKERIAKYLCEHTEDFFNTKNIMVAEILNISPETLSRMLRVFKNDGLIDAKAKTVDKEKLEVFFT